MGLPRAACLAAMLLLAGCGDYAWNGTSYGPNTDVGSAPPPPAAVPPGGQIYVVVPGDTVDSVAQQFGVPVQSLIDANHLAMPYALQGGQQLVIPGAAGSTGIGGGLYTVQPGDTLTRISRQHATTIAELASLNGLQPPYPLKVGQQLRLPGSPAVVTGTAASAAGLVMPPAQPAPSLPPAGNSTMTTESLAPPPGVSIAPQPTAGAATQSTGSTVPQSTSGATTTSANSGTTTASLPPPVLTPVNPAGSPPAPALAPPSPSQTSTQATESGAATSAGSGTAVATTPVLPPPPANSSTVSPIGQATAALNSGSGQSAGGTPAPRSAGKFLWPVNGKVISPFGPKDGGQHNDGINIAAPLGTPVRAAENGVVVYAGNELRGFGNLLLIRHADGWVSAYAHCDSLLVKRGASVNRGQVIARVGQSGNVTSPQLHFELRKGAQAVDPMTELAPQGA